MIDLLLDSETGDIVFPLASVQGIDKIRQELSSRLRFFQGEYYLDTRIGIPYFQGMLQKGVARTLIEAEIKSAILDDPSIISIAQFSSTFNQITRKLEIRFSATTSAGLVALSINI